MAQDAFPINGMSPELVMVPVVVTGAGAANPTKVLGNGVAITWVSTGKYRLTFSEHVGTYIGAHGTVGNTTPTATTPRLVQADSDSYTAAGKALDVFVTTPATDTVAAALSDLSSSMTMFVKVWFRRSAV